MKFSTDRINSFFLEMILVIFFFAISVTVTTQLFVSAAARANQSRDLSEAVFQAQNLAEQVRGITAADELPAMLRTAVHTNGGSGADLYRLEYDKQWNRTGKDPSYTINVTLKKTGSDAGILVEADIEVFRNQSGRATKLVSLNPARYLPQASKP